MTYKFKSVEHNVHQAEDLKHDLQEKKEQIVQLRNQMEGEKLQRYAIIVLCKLLFIKQIS